MSTPNSAWFPSEQELKDAPGIRRAMQVVLERVYALQKTTGTQAAAHASLAQTVNSTLAPGGLAGILGTNGSQPLDATGLVGKLSSAQLASVPNYAALPQPQDPVTQQGALISLNGVLYQFQGQTPQTGNWTPVASLGAKLEDTHANRLANFPASTYPIAILFYETDRTVFYENDGTFGSSNWTYKLGTMRGTLAVDQRPSDLGANDAGFLFFGTDWHITYRWSGTTWIYYDGVYEDVAANRPAGLGSADKGFLFISTDTLLLEYWNGAAWLVISPAGVTSIDGMTGAITFTSSNSGVGGPRLSGSAGGGVENYTLTQPGAWSTYSIAIISGLSGLSVTLERYIQDGKRVTLTVEFNATVTTGNIIVSLPLPVAINAGYALACNVEDLATFVFNIGVAFGSFGAGGIFITPLNLISGHSYQFTISGVYETS